MIFLPQKGLEAGLSEEKLFVVVSFDAPKFRGVFVIDS
jgi:hypothetical protein